MAQAAQLKKAGCDILQGYYYCHPVPLPEIVSDFKKMQSDLVNINNIN